MDEELQKASEGRYYHAIMRGRNKMGAYADKLSFEERWDVIHYIRSLQAKARGEEYKVMTETEMAKKAANFDLSDAESMLKSHKMLNTTLTLNDLKFKTGSADIDLAASKDLDDLVKILKESATMTINISGHTDNAGDAKKNAALSEERAKAVVGYLTKAGIDAKRLTAKGFGDSQPVADNSSESGKAQNRRTDITVTKE